MGDYPWGPHGPQSSPHSVTPNPTPAYVPPPPTPDFYTPPAVSSGGGTSSYGGGVASAATSSVAVGRGVYRPRTKGYILALILTFLFGPVGLFYASVRGALVMLFLLVAVPVTFGTMGMLPYGSPTHPFAILDHSSVMDGMWSLSVVFSMFWSVLAVRSFNAAAKARSQQPKS